MKGLAKRNNKTRGKTLRRRKSRGKTIRRRKTRGGGDDEENPRPEWLNEDNCKAGYDKSKKNLPEHVDKELFESVCRTELNIPDKNSVLNSFFGQPDTGGKKRKTHKKRK